MIMHLFGQDMFPVTFRQVHICQLFQVYGCDISKYNEKIFSVCDIVLFFS